MEVLAKEGIGSQLLQESILLLAKSIQLILLFLGWKGKVDIVLVRTKGVFLDQFGNRNFLIDLTTHADIAIPKGRIPFIGRGSGEGDHL